MTYETYQQMDKNSREREDQLYALFENKKTSEIDAFLKEGEYLRLLQQQVRTIISNFNSNNRNDKQNLNDLRRLRKFGLKKAKIKKDILRLNLLGVKSSVYPINKLFENKDQFLDFDSRQGKCHILCYHIARGLQDDECSVLTGFMQGLTNQTKYLHSVIRIKVGKYMRIIDTTMNAMVVEDFYKKLNDFEVLTEVSSSQIKQDAKILSRQDSIDLKKYFLYRDSYMKEISLNKRNCTEALSQGLDELVESNKNPQQTKTERTK